MSKIMVPCSLDTMKLVNDTRDFEETFQQALDRIIKTFFAVEVVAPDQPELPILPPKVNGEPETNRITVFLNSCKKDRGIDQTEWQIAILLLLSQKPEGLIRSTVISELSVLGKSAFSPGDLNPATQGPIWVERLSHARRRLLEVGYLEDPKKVGKVGLWKLTAEGMKGAKNVRI